MSNDGRCVMHYYQFNIADYRKDTMHLSRLEHSIYRDLIDWYYLDEKPIPLETQVVMRRLRLDTEEEAKALKNVLSDFFFEADGWRHHRIDQDIIDYHAMADKNKTNGKLGGRPKKTQSVSSGLPEETHTEPTRNPNQEPITNNHKHSVTNVTGDTSPKITDPDEIIFGYGVPLLVTAGTPEKNARSFLGGLRKSHGDDALIDKLRECVREKPMQPLEWLAKSLPPGGYSKQGKKPAPENFQSKDYGAGGTL